MIRGDVVYMDHCAWQEISRAKYDTERRRIAALAVDSCFSFALSVVNLEELTFGLDYHKPDSKRVRIAGVMADLGSPNQLLKPKEWLEQDETAAVLRGRLPARPFIPSRHRLCRELWKVLEDLANASPKRSAFLEGVRQNRLQQNERFCVKSQALLDSAMSNDNRVEGFPDQQVLEVVELRYEGACEGAIRANPQGTDLLRRLGVSAAVRTQHTIRAFHKAGLLLWLRCLQKGSEIDRSDLGDLWHVLFAAHVDVFVTRDDGLKRLVEGIREPRIRCVTLDEFLAEARALPQPPDRAAGRGG